MLVCVDVAPSEKLKRFPWTLQKWSECLILIHTGQLLLYMKFKPKFAKSLKLQTNKKETKMYVQRVQLHGVAEI
jgi:hypothetical protein